MDADSLRGIPVALPPANPFSPQPMPSGDTADGIVLALDPATQTINFKRAHILAGPSSLDVNMDLTGRKYNALIGAVGSYGMRTGLAAYVPPGVYHGYGAVTIAGPSGMQYTVTVWQGTTIADPINRPGIVCGTPIRVGGGVGVWPGPSNLPFQIPFLMHGIQFLGAAGTAAEITVTVYPKGDGLCGTALASVGADSTGEGYLPANHASSLLLWRTRGP